MKAFFVILAAFVRLEIRSKEVSLVAFSTVLLVAVLFATGMGTAFLDPLSVQKIFPFIFWSSIITTNCVALSRTFETELRTGIMEAFVSSGVSLRLVFFAKQLIVAAILFVTMAIGLMVLGSIFQISLQESALSLGLIAAVLSIGFAALGGLLSVVALGSRLKAALLPILLIPCCFPFFFAALELTYGILQRDPEVFSTPWLPFAVFLSIFYSLLGAALFPAAVKAQF